MSISLSGPATLDYGWFTKVLNVIFFYHVFTIV